MKESFEHVKGSAMARIVEIKTVIKDFSFIGETRRAIFKCFVLNNPKVDDISNIVLLCFAGEVAEKLAQNYHEGDIVSLSYNGLISHLIKEDENK